MAKRMANKSELCKVIIYKSRGEVSLVEQPTIECVFLAYSKFIFSFLTFILSNFLVWTLEYLKKLHTLA